MRLHGYAAFICLSLLPKQSNALVPRTSEERHHQSAVRPDKRAENNSSIPAPLVLRYPLHSSPLSTYHTPNPSSPSRRWDGTDGLWSSFNIQVGAQNLRVFPSTTSSATWALTKVSECGNRTSTACIDWHGGTFDVRKSETWEALGANVGLDRVSLSGPDGGAVGVEKVVVVGVEASNDTSIGALGLSSRGVNGLGSAVPAQSGLVQRMRDQKLIPSLSWGYTAGAGYCKSHNFLPFSTSQLTYTQGRASSGAH
jgi:hypothetical protein